jgi:ssDNA-binding Zn-finger/Zn-ribbon topoisomerase 1
MCKRQFIPGFERVYPKERPLCPRCGHPMHIYKKNENRTVFRCSGYPVCRSYLGLAMDGQAQG